MAKQHMTLTKDQATKISELINSLLVWNDCAQRELTRGAEFSKEEFDKVWGWQQETKQELRTMGIWFAGDAK